MPKYIVEIPIAGSISVEVEAEDPSAAEAAAWESVEDGKWDEDSLQWEFFEEIASGNVLHAPINRISVDEVE